MRSIQLSALALLLCLPASCQSSGSATESSTFISERVFVDGEASLSAQIVRAWYNPKKISVEVLFENHGTEMVHFPLDGISIAVGELDVTAKGFLGPSVEWDIDLHPGQTKPRKYGFHTLDFGAGKPGPGSYVLKITGLMDADNELLGRDILVPFEVTEAD